MIEPILVSKRDAAKALSISVRTLENLIAAREITVRRVGRRCLISRRALEAFARHDHPTTTSSQEDVQRSTTEAADVIPS
jgi:excisionase family DNA binding protein